MGRALSSSNPRLSIASLLLPLMLVVSPYHPPLCACLPCSVSGFLVWVAPPSGAPASLSRCGSPLCLSSPLRLSVPSLVLSSVSLSISSWSPPVSLHLCCLPACLSRPLPGSLLSPSLSHQWCLRLQVQGKQSGPKGHPWKIGEEGWLVWPLWTPVVTSAPFSSIFS